MAMSMPVSLPCSSSKCHGALVEPVPTIRLPRSSTVRSRLSPAACAYAFFGSIRLAAASKPPATPTPPAPIAARLPCPTSFIAVPLSCRWRRHLAASPAGCKDARLTGRVVARARGLGRRGRPGRGRSSARDRRRAGGRIRRLGRPAKRRCWWRPAPRPRPASTVAARAGTDHGLGLGFGEAKLGRAQQVAEAGEPKARRVCRRSGRQPTRARPKSSVCFENKPCVPILKFGTKLDVSGRRQLFAGRSA